MMGCNKWVELGEKVVNMASFQQNLALILAIINRVIFSLCCVAAKYLIAKTSFKEQNRNAPH